MHDVHSGSKQSNRLVVLVVEDDLDTAKSTSKILEHEGYEVHIATDGAAALAAAASKQPDIILLDLGLPKVNGYQVAKSLREKVTLKRPLLVAITGHNEPEDRLESEKAGIDLHLAKPPDWGELRKLLKRFDGIVH
jgi:CheY-like chemotaxis protein